MDILKIFRMQEPVSRELLSKNSSEIGKFKEAVQEKDVLLKNNRARIKELEEQVMELENKNRELEIKITDGTGDDKGFGKVMCDYNIFIEKICQERQAMICENEALHEHVKELEATTKKINENLEKAKHVISGMKENEDILKEQLNEYEVIIDRLTKNYNALKEYSEAKLAEANIGIDNKIKDNIREVAALKTKLLQSQAKIHELQKHVPLETVYSQSSMFEPLKSNLTL